MRGGAASVAGRMGTGRGESPRGPETSSRLTQTHGETEKRMHHLLTMRLKRVPQPPLILCSALARLPMPTRAHTHHTQGRGHKVVCLLQWGQKDHQDQGAGGHGLAPLGVPGLRASARVHPPAPPGPHT